MLSDAYGHQFPWDCHDRYRIRKCPRGHGPNKNALHILTCFIITVDIYSLDSGVCMITMIDMISTVDGELFVIATVTLTFFSNENNYCSYHSIHKESSFQCDRVSVAYLTGLHFIMWAADTVNTWDSWLSDTGLSTCTIHCRLTSWSWTISMFSGSSQEEIRSSYKRLALKWHPDKHNNSQEATKVNCQELWIPGNR